MYASTHNRRLEWAEMLHMGAAAIGAVLFASWAGFVVAEAFRSDFQPAAATYVQAAILAVVFGGYVIGWRRAVLGGVMSLVGTAAFFVVSLYGGTAAQAVAESPAMLFAVPGFLYLVSAHYKAAAKSATAGMT
jgi:CHASE2 domain-containing sensor protein